jgi:hypothetical protein
MTSKSPIELGAVPVGHRNRRRLENERIPDLFYKPQALRCRQSKDLSGFVLLSHSALPIN